MKLFPQPKNSLQRHSLHSMFFLLLSLLVQMPFNCAFVVQQQQQQNEMNFKEFADGKQTAQLPSVKLAHWAVANSLAASHQLLFDRLSEEKDRFVHRQMAKMMANWANGGENERRIPRPQRRWLMRTTELKDGSGGDQYVKRVVSESELNALLKNAWLGKKRR